MTVNDILALSDQEIGIYANGGYGQQKRHDFIVSLRAALLKVARSETGAEIKANTK